jgi:CBS domain-containing protein
MKLLEFRRIGDVVRQDAETPAFAVPENATLRAALTKMMETGTTILNVRNDEGKILGIVRIEDIVSASKQS